MDGTSIFDVLHLASPPRRVHTGRPRAVIDWSALPPDLIEVLLVTVWKADALAPRCAAVCTPFRDATHRAELALRQVDVPVPRPYLRIGVNESHEPMNDVVKHELAKVRAKAGDTLERFEPFAVELPGHATLVESNVVYVMTRQDATTILRSDSVAVDAPVLAASEGLLEATHIDPYMRYLMPDPSKAAAMLGAGGVRLPAPLLPSDRRFSLLGAHPRRPHRRPHRRFSLLGAHPRRRFSPLRCALRRWPQTSSCPRG